MPPLTNKNLNPTSKPRTRGHFVAWTLLLGLLAAILVIANHQHIYDWLRLRGYNAPPEITQISTEDGLKPYARKVFYVNHPQLESKADFAHSCPNGDKETAVLGCYVPNQRGIYVLSVTDPRLQGIEQVTAAHEMLHAAYDRLDAADKRQVDGWLMDYYQHGLTDQTIIDQMDSYKKSEPDQLVNEMHSIFGTEVASLPQNLQNYYERYFADRSQITTFYATYETEFSSRITQIKQDDAQLQGLKSQIDADEADLKAKQAELSTRQSQLDTARRSGSTAAYNAGVPGYNALVNAYNAEVQTVRGLVAQYNQLVAERNAIALEEQQLTQDISSQASPISGQ